MMYIDLNCDMGEGMDTDAAIMPFISSVNIACGYHAGDKPTIEKTVELAMLHNIAIGAHPGFDDKENFGRTHQHLSERELYDLIAAQLDIIQTVCRRMNAKLRHIKPHGALYNMAAKDEAMSTTIARAVKDADPSLCLFGLSNSWLIKAAAAAGLKTASEVFADRTYQPDGSLTPRTAPNALIHNVEQALEQVLQMVTQQQVTCIQGYAVPLKADTICLHGDGPHAVSFAKAVHDVLRKLQHT